MPYKNGPVPPAKCMLHSRRLQCLLPVDSRSFYRFINTVVASSNSTLAHLRPWTPSFEWLHTVRGLGKQILQLKECSGRPSLPPKPRGALPRQEHPGTAVPGVLHLISIHSPAAQALSNAYKLSSCHGKNPARSSPSASDQACTKGDLLW